MFNTSCIDDYVSNLVSSVKNADSVGLKQRFMRQASKSSAKQVVLSLALLAFSLGHVALAQTAVEDTTIGYEQIKVQWGDSVSEIAERYGISQVELLRLNNLSSTRIMLGQTLTVPSLNMASVEARAKVVQQNEGLANSVSVVSVQQNDTLSNIAATHGLSLSEIMTLNQLSSTRLFEGQSLIVNKALIDIEGLQVVNVASAQKLSDIAALHNVSVRTLMTLNNLSSARVVEGQTLIVATVPESALIALSETTQLSDVNSANAQKAADLFLQSELETVVVQPKDTLEAIASEFGQSVDYLMTLNHLSSTNIQVGDVLFVSAARSLEIEGESQYFTVRRGDSLEAIAERYDTSVNALMRANKLTGHRIFAGDRLRLPYNVNGETIASVSVEEATPETYVVKSGDTLYDIAYAYDLSIDKLIAANKLYGSTIHPGQLLQLVETEQAPAPEPLVYAVSSGDTLSAIANRFGVTIDEIAVFNNISPTGILSIGNELSIPENFATDYVAASQEVDRGASATTTYTVQKGDTLIAIASRFKTSVESIAVANRVRSSYIRVGQVLEVPAAGDVLAATSVREANVGSTIAWPLRGTITSDFGWRSLVVAGRNLRNHTGMDIDGHTGDLIYSAIDGTVTFSGWQGGYGNLVVVSNGNMETYYAHASALLVQEGETVAAGQQIARVGASGMATGSHLHFEVRIDGIAKDPASFLN